MKLSVIKFGKQRFFKERTAGQVTCSVSEFFQNRFCSSMVACVADALNPLFMDFTNGLDECVGRLQRRLFNGRFSWSGSFLVELGLLAERDSKNATVFFFRRSVAKRGLSSQAFLMETVETGDKNRDDFHCMQMTL